MKKIFDVDVYKRQQYQRKIEEYKSLIQKEYIRETAVDTVKERCSDCLLYTSIRYIPGLPVYINKSYERA